ncbi:MAG TPA: radical SAM family heme chaperone HemW [Vicinamibacterales bacterium]|nr:radical SAM family heme chaperone HemW [Vicinamibacterales bacterium]
MGRQNEGSRQVRSQKSEVRSSERTDAGQPIGLYVHIPFCSSICSYCNFNRGLLDSDLKVRYVTALEREILRAADDPRRTPSNARADTIFFGGGTPSLLEPAEIARLITACRQAFDIPPDAEITIETNPETATEPRLAAFRAAGANRISFGVQSFDDDELKRLGRIHSAARAREAILWGRAAGFDNLSFDLMLWLPGQSFSSWLRTVDEAIALRPDHLSLYLLELYPNAPLKEAMAREPWSQAPDDEAADMYLAGLDRLDHAGFGQYEISNVSRPGRESRHNLKYWTGGSWWGFGCGAHATVEGERWHNVSGIQDYVDRIEAGAKVDLDHHQLSEEERQSETLFTGLRLSVGIDREAFRTRFGMDPWIRYQPDLASFVQAGTVWERDGRMGLSRQGMLIANEILVTFV